MPIRSREDAVEIEHHISQVFVAPASERAAALRRMFMEAMDFDSATGSVSFASAPKNVTLPAIAERVARMSGVDVVYVALDIDSTERVRKAEAAEAARLISNELGDDLLLVMTNTPEAQLHFIRPEFTSRTPSLRRMVIERDLPRRTAVQQLSNIYWVWKDTGSIIQAIESTFDVEAMTDRFFTEYKNQFDKMMKLVEGFGSDDEDVEAKRLFVQTLFNRLMFVYFLSRKGWLEFGGSKDYLNALWQDHLVRTENTNFYDHRLKILFFTALNNERSSHLREKALGLVGDPPFLNGGLFDDGNELDRRRDLVVPDEAIGPILDDLFDKFNFTIMESTPFDLEVAVDPEMLGKVFEELVTGRHASGSYYTPRPVVSFMCREALKGYLESQATGADQAAIEKFVDHRDTSGLSVTNATTLGAALNSVTVVDPACGSGAYLLGMLHELVDLFQALYTADLARDPKDLYKLKLSIIESSLYGADIDQFAVNIAMLRLWLSLAVDFEGLDPLPLPNLDFKIVWGDSLTAPAPVINETFGLLRHRAEEVAATLAILKGKHVTATGPEKDQLRSRIESLEHELKESENDLAPDGSVDWRVEFAEVFASRGGFDIVIANPPYVRKEEISPTIKTTLRENFGDAITGRSDLYCSFYARGVQLLRIGGMHVFVCSNSWLDVGYGVKLQDFLLITCEIRAVYESQLDRQFSTADVNTIISVLKRNDHPEATEARFVLITAPTPSIITDEMSSVVKIRHSELRRSGTVKKKYVGNKWGGKFLRAPTIYKRIFGDRSEQFQELNSLASIIGYIHDNNTGQSWPPQEVVWSLRDVATVVIEAGSDGVSMVGVNPSGNSTIYAPILFARTFGTRHLILWAQAGVLGKEFYKILPNDSDLTASIIAQLNSTLGLLQREILGIRGLGGGAIKFAAADVGQFQILPDLNMLDDRMKHLDTFITRSVGDIEFELEQTDRKAIDSVIFDHLGLSGTDRDAVYKAAFNLVNSRRIKARSISA